LSNGLKALLIQHFVDENEKSDPVVKRKDKESESEESGSDEEEGDDDEEEEGGEEDGSDEDDDAQSKEKLSAVSLAIHVGSFQDPPSIQGLAHFAEHLIFMGSEKYPKENELDKFVSAHGGADNAQTECEYTMFYFDVVEDFLEGAIDRFAQLFISPLMLRDSMEREMLAVESEFQNSISDDDCRIQQLIASLAVNPISTFTWGNLKTLKEGVSNDVLYAAVHAFVKKHYVASRMYLCVESSQSLDQLQELAEKYFAEIDGEREVHDAIVPIIDHRNAFKPEFFNKIYYVKPKADKYTLLLNFVMPSMQKQYKSKPHDYLAYIIQHEGAGSISSYLKKHLLALRIEAGADDHCFDANSMFTIFSIDVTLTEKGLANVDEVLQAIFSFLLLLQQTSLAEYQRFFVELKDIKDTHFKYQEEKTPTDNVEEFVVNTIFYDAADVLRGSDVYLDFDGDKVIDLIKLMNEGKFNFILLTDKHNSYDKVEQWFGTEYSEEGELCFLVLTFELLITLESFRNASKVHRLVERKKVASNRFLHAKAK